MNRMRCILVLLLMSLLPFSAGAEHLLMARATQAFPEAMLKLQASIREHGYIVSRVQRVDIGLTNSGFVTDKYRVVFYGKPDEIRALTGKWPELAAYLPLKIVIFAEGRDTLFLAGSPLAYRELFRDPGLELTLVRWERDLRSIMDDMRVVD